MINCNSFYIVLSRLTSFNRFVVKSEDANCHWMEINTTVFRLQFLNIDYAIFNRNKIENGNGEYVKKTTVLPKSRQRPKTTNGPPTQQDNIALGGGLQLASKTNVY